MKNLLLVLLLVALPAMSLAGGPDGVEQSVTSSGASVSFNPTPTSPSPQVRVYVTCATADITVSAWRLDVQDLTEFSYGTYKYVKFTPAWSDTCTIPMGVTVPIEGKFDHLLFDTAAGTHTVNMLIYVD
jgi:hypothetical protein